MKWFVLLASCIVLISMISFALAAEIPVAKEKYVNDFAEVLNETQASGLRALFAGVELESSAEVVFISDGECTSRGGPSQYALDLFTKWGVGKADKDNGLLILYCKAEGKIWVTTGYGLEGILPDSKLGRMLDDYYVPLRDRGDVSGGIVSFSEWAVQVILENKEEVMSGQAGPQASAWDYLPFVIWLIIILLVIISRLKRLKKEQKHGKHTSLWWIPIFLPSGGGHSGGGFGGGFGGGGSGGGGAGR